MFGEYNLLLTILTLRFINRVKFNNFWKKLFAICGLWRQTALNSAGSVALCDAGAAPDSHGILLTHKLL